VPQPLAVIMVPALAAVALAGCTVAPRDNAGDGVVRIVASTNVYGDIAESVAAAGGTDVEITSIIDTPGQDPHEYQANGRVQLALSRADIVIENGGGYDDFVDTMLDASGNDTAAVLNAVDISGMDAGAEGFNEHVWFDYRTVAAVATALAGALGEADPDHAVDYASAASAYSDDVMSLLASAVDSRTAVAGAGVVVTEPVPLYLLSAFGFENLTPPDFTEAIEQDTDVPPALLREVLGLVSAADTAIVVYNGQTGGPQTDAVLAAAKDAGVPAVAVTETLPAGMHYLGWQASLQRDILTAIGAA